MCHGENMLLALKRPTVQILSRSPGGRRVQSSTGLLLQFIATGVSAQRSTQTGG